MRSTTFLLVTVLVLVGWLSTQHAAIGQRLVLWSAPLIVQLQVPSQWIQDVSDWMQRQSDLQQQLFDAKAQLHRTPAQTGELAYLRQENLELRHLLAIPKASEYIWHAARVVARTPGVPQYGLMLEVKGAAVDDAVVTESGLVGLVTAVQGEYATVRTLRDGALAIPVMNASGTIAALIRSNGATLTVNMVAKREQPAIGAELLTSGAGGLLPPGIPVATIAHIAPQAGSMFVAVAADPVAQWHHLRWLAVAHRRHITP